MNKFKKYIKRVVKLIKLDEMEFLPGHLAFYLIFLIVPVISLIGIVATGLGISTSEFILNENVPKVVANLVMGSTNIDFNNFNIFIFLVVSLWMASGGAKAIIISSNLLFKIKEKDSIKIRMRAIIMVIVLFILIVFIVTVPVLGDMIVKMITSNLHETGIQFVSNIYHLLKYPISIILMFILLKILYTMAPTINISTKYMNHGALFTTIMWFTLSRIYSFYLNNFNNYNLYYGSLSVILILLVWVYLLSYIFVIGMALNADNYLFQEKENNK